MTALRPPLLLTLTLLLAAPPSIAAPSPFEAAEEALKATDHDAARRLYAQALASPATLPVSRAYALARYGLALRQVDRHDEALLALNEAVAAAQGTSDEQTEAAARRYRGRVFHERGELERAREDYGRARQVFERLGPKDELLKSLLAEAGIEYEQGRTPEAYDGYAKALELARTLRDTRQEEVALYGVAWILSHLGEGRTAVWLVRQARELAVESGEPWRLLRAEEWLALTLLDADLVREALDVARAALARVPVEQQQRRRTLRLVIAHAYLAEQAYGEALAALEPEPELEDGSPYKLDEVFMSRAEALIGLGRFDDAGAALRHAKPLAVHPMRRARARGLAARLALEQGKVTEATRLLEETLALHELRRDRIPPENLVRFARQYPVRYAETLLRLRLQRGETEAAASLVQQLKSRAFSEQLRRERAADEGPGWSPVRRARGLDVIRASRRLDALHERHDSLIRVGAMPPPSLPVLDFYQLEDQLLVFIYHRGRVSLRRLDLDAHTLTEVVASALHTVRSADPAWEKPAQRLAELTVGPLADLLDGLPAGPLAIVPHRALHDVSFAMLPYGSGLLIDRFDVFYSPSIPALIAMSEREPRLPRDGADLMVVADAEKDLPDAFLSAQYVAARFPGSRLFVRDRATEESVRTHLPTAGLVHFAVHGHQAQEQRPAHLRLRSTRGADGELRADEVLQLDLSASLVILSACETGVGRPILGDEIPGVLDRAFLIAGADAVISTRWKIDDTSARLLTDYFYAEFPEKGRLGAFLAAQRALRNGSTNVLSVAARARRGGCRGLSPCGGAETPLSHPYHWAGFTFLGDYR